MENDECSLHNKTKDKILKEINQLDIVKGKWRKEPYPMRIYKPISEYTVTTTVSSGEGSEILSLLSTPLNGFLGQAYNYNDNPLTEQWMSSFASEEGKATPSFDEINRTQIEIIVEILINRVQDQVCTDAKHLEKPTLILGSEVLEQPVWGIDYSTRRHIELVIEAMRPKQYDTDAVRNFIEKRLLPAINAQEPSVAHRMEGALEYITSNSNSTLRDLAYATAIQSAMNEFDSTHFRIHPKGTGVICNIRDGIKPHVVVTEYLGELYPPYRWCEKLEVIEMAQAHYDLKPTLPDFYNILLERPRNDPKGYDASQKANLGSSCSHSCDPNCTSSVVSRNGKLTIVLTSNRQINYGEELCMDYCSITSSEVEARAAICLCGMTACRGAFLRLSTQDALQQIFSSNCGPVVTFTYLLRSCGLRPISENDKNILHKHGLLSAALGSAPPSWLKKYAADLLRFIEFERKALPCALLRSRSTSMYTYTFVGADGEARSVMEQRIQSLVCCCSLINRVLAGQPSVHQTLPPLNIASPSTLVSLVWQRMTPIPSLLEKHLLRSRSHNQNQENIQGQGKLTNESGSITTQNSHIDKIKHCVKELKSLILNVPKTTTALRELILKIRLLILAIKTASNPLARLELLCDILLLWAYTTTFVTVENYNVVKSDPISILARELGTNIRRSMLAKKDVMRRGRSKSSQAQGAVALEEKSADMSNIADLENPSSSIPESAGGSSNHKEEEEEEVDDNAVIDASNNVSDVMDQSLDYSCSEGILCDDRGLGDIPPCLLEGDVLTPIDDGAGVGSSDTKDKASAPRANKTPKNGHVRVRDRERERDRDEVVPPNEVVFTESRTYAAHFIFEQALGWVHAGTDEKVTTPDLFGCVKLPLPTQCFGTSEKSYGRTEKALLVSILRDDVKQTWPWPSSLKQCFSVGESKKMISEELLGSPMVEASLGSTWNMRQVLQELSGRTPIGGIGADASDQYDQKLPPEPPCNWIQCDLCGKWRRMSWDVDETDFVDKKFACAMNYWNVEAASCDAPADFFDDEKEGNIVEEDCEGNANLDQYVVGTYRDVYCIINRIFYEAKILAVKPPPTKDGLGQVLFHFKGWNSKTDEWIDAGSPRIQPHRTQSLLKNVGTKPIPAPVPVNSKKAKSVQQPPPPPHQSTGTITRTEPTKTAQSKKRPPAAADKTSSEAKADPPKVFFPGQAISTETVTSQSKRKRKSNEKYFAAFTS